MNCANESLFIDPIKAISPFCIDVLISMIGLLYEKSMSRVRIAMEHNEKCKMTHHLNMQGIKSAILLDEEMKEYEIDRQLCF